MRFLINDKATMDLAIELIYNGIRAASMGNSDKDKIRATMKTLLEDFLCLDNLKILKETSAVMN